MKNFYYLVLLLIPVTGYAQTSGTITYQTEIKLDFSGSFADDPAKAALLKNMPKSHTTQSELLFTPAESLYRSVAKEEKEQITTDAQNSISLNFSKNGNIVYHNRTEDSWLEQNNFMNRLFLISEKEERKWKITGETKEILGYSCTRAVDSKNQDLEAWFTTELPTGLGPAHYTGLPGTVLQVNADKGKRVTTAITFTENKPEITVPDEGKKISREKFMKVRDQKLEEMRKQYGGKDGKFMIIQGG